MKSPLVHILFVCHFRAFLSRTCKNRFVLKKICFWWICQLHYSTLKDFSVLSCSVKKDDKALQRSRTVTCLYSTTLIFFGLQPHMFIRIQQNNIFQCHRVVMPFHITVYTIIKSLRPVIPTTSLTQKSKNWSLASHILHHHTSLSIPCSTAACYCIPRFKNIL